MGLKAVAGKMPFDELTRLVQTKLGLSSQNASREFIYWFFETIEHEAVEKNRAVRIPEFGTFLKRHRKGRQNKVIGTGAIVDVPAITALGFKLSKNRLVKHI